VAVSGGRIDVIHATLTPPTRATFFSSSKQVNELTKLGVHIAERVPMHVPSNPHNSRYMLSKRDRMHHILPEDMELPLAGAGVGVVGGAVPDAEDVSRPLPGAADAATGTPSQRKPAGPAYEVVHGHDTTKGYAFGKQSVLDAIQAVKEGKIVVVTDDEDRENEGDLIMAAEKATPELVGFIVRHTSGVLCVSMEDARLKELELPPMVVNNEDPKQTAYTVSVDYRHGITTGISAADRAAAFRALADPRSTAADFQRPGHVFPLRYRDGGVLARGGHTEASLDLTRLAGLRPAGVLAEVVNDDGSVTRLPGLRKLAAEHGLVLTSVQDIIAYRVETERRESP
jgi:3,4-dihydroxy 2-butanone 4-phosphate synthase/GTP cyclohydrolase II